MSLNTHAISAIAEKNRDSITPVSPYVFYKMHETSGNLADAAGVGGDAVVSGSGTPYANEGWITLNATDDTAVAPWSAELDAIMGIDNMVAGGQLIITFDRYFDGAIDGQQGIFTWGDLIAGGWSMALNTSEQYECTNTKEGGTDYSSGNNFTGYAFNTASTRTTVTLDIRYISGTKADLYLYADGVAVSTPKLNKNIAGDNGTLASEIPTDSVRQRGLTLFSRRVGAATYTGYMEGRCARFLAIKRTTTDTSLAVEINAEMMNCRGDLPIVLDGK